MQALRNEEREFITNLGVKSNDIESEIYRIARESQWTISERAKTIEQYRSIKSDIKEEIARATRFVSANHSLATYNEWLLGLGLPQEESLYAAKRSLRTVYIGIYDLLDGIYENQKRNSWELRQHLLATKTVYDLQRAKGDLVRVFLRRIYV
jgi:hypothetical protein